MIKHYKTMIVYAGLSLFALVFNLVYAQFSHGVSSSSMANMWLWLLGLGVAVFFLLDLFCPQIQFRPHYRLFYNLYNSGVAVLVNGMLLQGILEIAGGTSEFPLWFTYIAVAFFAGAAVSLGIRH